MKEKNIDGSNQTKSINTKLKVIIIKRRRSKRYIEIVFILTDILF